LAIFKSHWGRRNGALAHRRQAAATCRIVVEWKGRAFTRWQGGIRIRCRRDCLTTALDLDMPLLHLQHEFATRGATAARKLKALPRFLVAYGRITSGV